MLPLYSWGDELDMERGYLFCLQARVQDWPLEGGGTGSFRASVRLVRKSKGGFRYLLRWEDEKTWSSLKLPHRKVHKVPGQGFKAPNKQTDRQIIEHLGDDLEVPGIGPRRRQITRRPRGRPTRIFLGAG